MKNVVIGLKNYNFFLILFFLKVKEKKRLKRLMWVCLRLKGKKGDEFGFLKRKIYLILMKIIS